MLAFLCFRVACVHECVQAHERLYASVCARRVCCTCMGEGVLAAELHGGWARSMHSSGCALHATGCSAVEFPMHASDLFLSNPPLCLLPVGAHGEC